MDGLQDPHAVRETQPLRWRIPPEGDPRVLRVRLAQVGLASVVCALVLLVAAPREALGWGLLALVPVAVGMAFWQWQRHQRLLAGPENTWIDDAGVHWIDAAGQEQLLGKSEMAAYRIAVDDDTLRPVPSLTVYLQSGHESQPLEIHPPATPDEIRRVLGGNWRLDERPRADGSQAPYDVAIDLYSECHDEFQEWHLEGTQEALGKLFYVVAEVASLPLAPPGLKAANRVVRAQRREASQLAIQHDRQHRLGGDTIAGPAELLLALAAEGRIALAGVPAGAAETDLKFDLVLGRRNTWTFHLHVRL
jgi:hypothetical protein